MTSRTSMWTLLACTALMASAAAASSLRYYGNGVDDIDRVKIRIDDAETPADIGATDFTIEFWVKGFASDYTPSRNKPGGNCGGAGEPGRDWIHGNIVLDRALWGNDLHGDFGISVYQDGISFGVVKGNGDPGVGVCGSTPVLSAAGNVWHHVALTRSVSSGTIRVFVDGQLEDSATGLSGDVSYDDSRSFQNGDANTDPFLVIGAEKYSLGNGFPSFNGWIDELRLSTVVRYAANFTPPATAFLTDADTAALYHFDEASGDSIVDDTLAGSLSPGARRFGSGGTYDGGGARPAGPVWSTETPFAPNPGVLRFSTATATVAEDDGMVSFDVLRINGSAGSVSVDFATLGGTASEDVDYQRSEGTLSWPDGDSAARTVEVRLIDDTLVEADESFSLALNAPLGGAVLGMPATVQIVLEDNGGSGGGGGGDDSDDDSAGGESSATALAPVTPGGLALAGGLLYLLRRRPGYKAAASP